LEIWGRNDWWRGIRWRTRISGFPESNNAPLNSIGRKLEDDDVFTPLLFEDEEGTARANDWARSFMRGTHLHHERWKELIADEEQGVPLVPILALAYERHLDPEMRPYEERITRTPR
jgi:yecA family protein